MKTIQTKDGGIPLDFKISHAELTAVGHGHAKRGLPGRGNIFEQILCTHLESASILVDVD